ncbi:16S rRNA (uracil(1498)-N(3))-methyltransferase [Hymenobacter busanensis]|uniref:Ribosomal RNA small subunit methyltransferase E n=1 Tax=Hymenobacter busanensis TaxID=2607656 RepID=A0A7L4ZSE2_9BACT|nr:16S rRNA (uracil(1498)-N(3))-methyltransferase [Hymenobacter busanensis]KAA9325927.1 16S rRNA (uracil(1498)-N(3))-methyltransferase [Hymenobacter busanensis]QHJ06234.1 16S rRNA (uracil(1498)-N(3))-methyltransferase [Hymenobacter busanensis]
MPHTFYAPDLAGLAYTLPEDESKHAVRVLRLREGDAVELLNGRGGIFRAAVAEAEAKRCQLRIVGEQQVPRRPYFVHVAVAPTKNLDRMEWLVEKATEIGIDRLSFLRCARSERRDLKLERLERIAVSALKQSGQAWLPQLDELTDFAAFARTVQPATTFIAHLEAGERTALSQVAAAGPACCVLIGPEGDFTPAEIELALGQGIRPVTLGASRLRTETAALAAVFTAHIARE